MTLLAEQPVAQRALALHPQVALRREPFGALLYHYGTRRLVFLKHPDVVDVVEALGEYPTVAEALASCEIVPARHSSFVAALTSLVESGMLHERVARR